MPLLKYLGNNVGLIHGFHLSYDGAPTSAACLKALGETDQLIKATNMCNLIATTADKYQKETHEVLKANGFTPVLTFKSAHNTPGEAVTFWVKHQDDAPDMPKDAPIAAQMPWNCSVSINEDRKRLTIKTVRPKAHAYLVQDR